MSARSSARDPVAEVRAQAARVLSTGSDLRELGPGRVVSGLDRALRTLGDPSTALGAEAREALPSATGLSQPMVEWALDHSLPDEAALVSVADALSSPRGAPRPGAVPAPHRLTVVVLAGNVFTAAVRALCLPLLAGSPVVAKASSRDDTFPRLLKRALDRADPDVGQSLAVLTFAGGETALEDSLFSQADLVSVYGNDHTVADVRARLSGTTCFVAHGHGLGAMFVPATALTDAGAAERVVAAAALDVAAYDQRGCLSPHAVYVERGSPVGPRDLAEMLARTGLAEMAVRLPRGPLPLEAAAAQVQWRGVAAARGDLFEGEGFATSHEGDGALRVSPGWRNVAVLDCEGVEDLGRRLLPLGVHLKALGVAADLDERHRIAASLPSPLAPRVCEVGQMQTPPFDALADGVGYGTGLTRYIDVD